MCLHMRKYFAKSFFWGEERKPEYGIMETYREIKSLEFQDRLQALKLSCLMVSEGPWPVLLSDLVL